MLSWEVPRESSMAQQHAVHDVKAGGSLPIRKLCHMFCPRQRFTMESHRLLIRPNFRVIAQGPSMMIVRGWDSSMAWRMTNVVRVSRG